MDHALAAAETSPQWPLLRTMQFPASWIELFLSSIGPGSSHFRRVTGRTRSAVQTTPDELVPCTLGIVGVGKKIEIGPRYHSFLDKRRKIEDATQIRFLDENDGDGGHLRGLH